MKWLKAKKREITVAVIFLAGVLNSISILMWWRSPGSVAVLRDTVISLGTAVVGIVAVVGFLTWRKTFRGPAQYEVAVEILSLLDQIKSEIDSARGPREVWEEIVAQNEVGIHDAKNYDEQKMLRQLVSMRYRNAEERYVALYKWKTQAKVKLGEEAVSCLLPFMGCFKKLLESRDEFARLVLLPQQPQIKKRTDAASKVLFSPQDATSGDQFGQELQQAIRAADSFLRTFL